MNLKEQKLYEFYEACVTKGYHNMSDATESLKAKVIATDLEIKYKDIARLYEQAKVVYEEEIQRKQQEQELQKKSGKQMLKLAGVEEKSTIRIYQREDGSIYHTIGSAGWKYEGGPSICVHDGGAIVYTYHPSKTVFTGAVSGSVAMGGFHTTQDYYTEGISKTGKGFLQAVSGENVITIRYAEIDKEILEKFKRIKWVQKNIKNDNILYCEKQLDSMQKQLHMDMVFNQTDFYSKMSTMSMVADLARLPMEECQTIAKFLQDIISKNYPLSDEELYQKALSLEAAKTSKELLEGKKLFESISDYKDSLKRANNLKERYDDVLQHEKEQAILRKEAAVVERKALGKKLCIIAPIIIVVIVVIVFIGMKWSDAYEQKQKEQQKLEKYEEAYAVFETGNYSTAITAFSELKGYKDSDEMFVKSHFNYALKMLKDENYENAIHHFEVAKEYAEDNEIIAECDKYIKECNERIAEEEALREAEEWAKEVERACENRNWDWFEDNIDKFKLLTGEEIEEMIVGEWYSTSASGNLWKNEYTETGEYYSYSGDNLEKKTISTYYIEDDCLFTLFTGTDITNDYVLFDLGNGYYLKCYVSSDGRLGNPSLMWPVSFGK